MFMVYDIPHIQQSLCARELKLLSELYLPNKMGPRNGQGAGGNATLDAECGVLFDEGPSCES